MVYREGMSNTIRCQRFEGATKEIAAVCISMAALLFGLAAARADAVLDWNEIAVNTAIANGQDPFH